LNDTPTRPRTPEGFNKAGASKLPGHLGLVITEVSQARVVGELSAITKRANDFTPARSLLSASSWLWKSADGLDLEKAVKRNFGLEPQPVTTL